MKILRFLVNANFGTIMIEALRQWGFVAISASETLGLACPDFAILEYAEKNDYIVVTKDSDFGELIFHQNKPHAGVLYIREEDEPTAIKLVQEYLRAGNDPRGKFVRLRG